MTSLLDYAPITATCFAVPLLPDSAGNRLYSW